VASFRLALLKARCQIPATQLVYRALPISDRQGAKGIASAIRNLRAGDLYISDRIRTLDVQTKDDPSREMFDDLLFIMRQARNLHHLLLRHPSVSGFVSAASMPSLQTLEIAIDDHAILHGVTDSINNIPSLKDLTVISHVKWADLMPTALVLPEVVRLTWHVMLEEDVVNSSGFPYLSLCQFPQLRSVVISQESEFYTEPRYPLEEYRALGRFFHGHPHIKTLDISASAEEWDVLATKLPTVTTVKLHRADLLQRHARSLPPLLERLHIEVDISQDNYNLWKFLGGLQSAEITLKHLHLDSRYGQEGLNWFIQEKSRIYPDPLSDMVCHCLARALALSRNGITMYDQNGIGMSEVRASSLM
jgi:hypothetical protein